MGIDIGHQWGGDLHVNSRGDLAPAEGSEAITQRLLRRLLTNPVDYIWNPDYGAGLPRFVGTTAHTNEIAAIVRSQMMLETAIARTPEPSISVSDAISAERGAFRIDVRFADASSGTQTHVSIPVSA